MSFATVRAAAGVIGVAVTAVWCAVAHGQGSTADGIVYQPQTIHFLVGDDKCDSVQVHATNNTSAPITDPHFTVIESPGFSIDRHFQACTDPLEPRQTCSVYVRFCTRQFDTVEGSVKFSASDREIRMTGSTYRREVSR